MQAHPNQEIHVLSANTQELLNKLDHGLIDLALVEGYFPRGEYSQQLFSQECYLAVCSPDYPLPANPCRLEDLLGERLILRESGSGTRDILEKYLDAKGLSVEDFRTRTVLSNLGGIIELASLGCGVTFLYERAVRRELAAKKLRIIPLQDLNISHDFSFLWRKNSIFHSEYAALCKEL